VINSKCQKLKYVKYIIHAWIGYIIETAYLLPSLLKKTLQNIKDWCYDNYDE
jgi:hypothetical protein